MASINKILLFDHGEALQARDLMPHHYENQITRPALLMPYIGNARDARNAFADVQGPVEFKPAAGPHPARQRNRRQKYAAAGVPVYSKLALAMPRQEIQPMPEWRQRVAEWISGSALRIFAVESGREKGGGRGRHFVFCGLRAPDPFPQVYDIHLTQYMTNQNLGFLGVGRMGGRMARRLIQAGFALTIYDTSEAVMEPFLQMGAKRAGSPAEVASAAEIVLGSLPTPQVVHSAALGPNGIAEGSRVKIFVDTSTTGATYAKRVAEGLAAKGIAAVDAPVSGGLGGAERGTLAVMVSCSDETFEIVKPVLIHLGKLFLVGSQPGQGQTMKLLNNLLSATAMAISSEAVVMGVKAGLDPKQIVEVINSGTGRNSATEDKIPRFVIPRTFNLGFAIGLLNKDIRLCMEEADALGVPMVVGSAVKQLLAITVGSEGVDADMSEIVKPVERWAGVRVGGEAAGQGKA